MTQGDGSSMQEKLRLKSANPRFETKDLGFWGTR